MINSIFINGFKGLANLHLQDTSRVNLIGGKNNVGKSSILESLFLFYDRFNPDAYPSQLGRRGIEMIPFEPDFMWAPLFSDFDLKNEISVLLKRTKQSEQLKIKYNPNYSLQVSAHGPNSKGLPRPAALHSFKTQPPTFALDITFEQNTKKHVSHLFVSNGVLQLKFDTSPPTKSPPAYLLTAKSIPNPKMLAMQFGQLDILGKQDYIVKFLQIIEPRMKSLSSVSLGDNTLIYGDIGLGRKIPINLMGDGVARLLSIVIAIATTRGGLVLIDEFENGIHYSVMSKIWEATALAAKDFNCQVVATTHSYECIKSAVDGLSSSGLDSEFRYLRLDRDEKNVTAQTYDFPSVSAAIENNWEVR